MPISFCFPVSATILSVVLSGCSYWNGTGRASWGTGQYGQYGKEFRFISVTDEHFETTRLVDGTYHSRSVASRDVLNVGFLFPGVLTYYYDFSHNQKRVLWAVYSAPPITYHLTLSLDEPTGDVHITVRRTASADASKELNLVQPTVTFNVVRGIFFALIKDHDNSLNVTQLASFTGTRPRSHAMDDTDIRTRQLIRGFEPILRELAESPEADTSGQIATMALRRYARVIED